MSTEQDNNDTGDVEEVTLDDVAQADEVETQKLPELELVEPDPAQELWDELEATTARLKAVSAA